MLSKILLICVCLSVFTGCTRLSDSLDVPGGLTCEYRTNPMGIDTEAPRFRWVVRSAEQNQIQTAYQVLVASKAEHLKSNKGDFWDSGKVVSGETAQIEYSGKPLLSAQPYFWKVRSWDKNDRPSRWSEVQQFSTGFFEDSLWQAQWIGYDAFISELPEDTLQPKRKRRKLPYQATPSPYLRKEFNIEKPFKRAVVYTTALGVYELHLNGQRVGEDYFMPGWTDYNKRLYYNAYDVTDLLQDSLNAFAAILSDGWYAGNVANRGQQIYGQRLRLFAQLHLEYNDGTQEKVMTDSTWKASYGPIREGDMQAGETYNAHMEMPGWHSTGFDDSDWDKVNVSPKPEIILQAYPAQGVRKIEEIRPLDIHHSSPGRYIVDMGQNFAGWVRLRMNGNSGDKVVLRFAEKLKSPDSLFTKNLRSAKATDTYILKGGREEIWEPRFTYHGFQFVEVSGYPGELRPDDITGIVVHSDLPRSGFFECSDTLINRIYKNALWSQKSNFFDIPTDCPQRDERMGWSGDVQVFLPTSIYNMDVGAFLSRWMQDLVDGQFPDGRLPSTAPRIYNRVAAGWGDAGVILPWQLYRAYGDTRIIETHYASMQRWMNFLIDKSDSLISGQGSYGDWQNADAETPIPVFSTAYFANSARLMMEMARATGKNEDMIAYKDLYHQIRDAFTKKFVSDSGKIEGDTQGAYLLALQFDLIPEGKRPQVFWHLMRKIRENDGHPSTGLICSSMLLPVLSEGGEAAVAYQMLAKRTYPSWGFQIANGATTPWERWDGYSAEKGFHEDITNSFNHFAFGAVAEWFYTNIAGINTDAPGFKHVIIRPRPGGGLTYAKTAYESIRGRISVDWRWDDDTFSLKVTIPANTTASVFLPVSDESKILEDGEEIDQHKLIQLEKRENGEALLKVPSGNYEFEVN